MKRYHGDGKAFRRNVSGIGGDGSGESARVHPEDPGR